MTSLLTNAIRAAPCSRRAQRWMLARTYALQPASQRRGVFMWHHGRCGSSVVGRLLKQHPQVRWYGEIFNAYAERGTTRPGYLDDLRMVQIDSSPQLGGFELKGLPSQHLPALGVSLPQFVDQVRALEFNHAVFLDRRNTLRKLISVQIVDQGLRSSFHMSEGDASELRGRLHLDINAVRIQGKDASLLDMLHYIEEETVRAREVVSARYDMLSLWYEDHIEADPQCAYRMLLEYLSLPHHDAEVSLKRINAKSMRELVVNYKQVEDLLASTPYAWMLDG